MKHTRGFITIATGREEYYHLARNLLRSYRHFCPQPLPFALLCDRENELTADFDNVITFPNGASNSYLDKLSLGDFLPYDETIFIDADCLAFGDLNSLFDWFQDADDFSCFGRVLPLEDKTGWFEVENLGELREKVSYVVGLHGGIYYMRRGETTRKVFDTARALVPDYPRFHFKGKFDTPGDEPLVALSMALNGCHPVPFRREAICCYWEYEGAMTVDITQPVARVEREPKVSTGLLHWGTRFTRELEYQEQIALLEILESPGEDAPKRIRACRQHFERLMAARRRKNLALRVKNKIKRTIGIQ